MVNTFDAQKTAHQLARGMTPDEHAEADFMERHPRPDLGTLGWVSPERDRWQRRLQRMLTNRYHMRTHWTDVHANLTHRERAQRLAATARRFNR